MPPKTWSNTFDNTLCFQAFQGYPHCFLRDFALFRQCRNTDLRVFCYKRKYLVMPLLRPCYALVMPWLAIFWVLLVGMVRPLPLIQNIRTNSCFHKRQPSCIAAHGHPMPKVHDTYGQLLPRTLLHNRML